MELLATAALWNSYTCEMREWEIFASLSHWLDTTLDWELFLLLILYTTHASGKYLIVRGMYSKQTVSLNRHWTVTIILKLIILKIGDATFYNVYL